MTTASEIQSLLRFLSQEARLPLPKALATIKNLQSANLTNPSQIADTSLANLSACLPDDIRTARQVHTAAKRISKKRAAPDGETPASAPAKRHRKSQFELQSTINPTSPEASLALPVANRDSEEIARTILVTNRAPLVLAFAVVLLRYTMPGQPLSSRLSLAQAAVSANSRSKAISLGIEKGKSAEEEGWGVGQVVVRVMGREVRTMRRVGWEDEELPTVTETEDGVKTETKNVKTEPGNDETALPPEIKEPVPAYWALDLEALKKHNGGFNDGTGVGLQTGLPIYTPQSARAYLMKSFATRVEPAGTKVSKGRGQFARRVEENVSLLLGALELLFESWANLAADELDRRAWAWYVQVRPDVPDGIAGWGARGDLKLQSLLDLRRTA